MVCVLWAEHAALRWPPEHLRILLMLPGGASCLSQKMTHGDQFHGAKPQPHNVIPHRFQHSLL